MVPASVGHAVCWTQPEPAHAHCGSPPASSCVHAALLVGLVGQEPIARPHDPVKEQALKPPPSTKHVAAVIPASPVGQDGAEQVPVHEHGDRHWLWVVPASVGQLGAAHDPVHKH